MGERREQSRRQTLNRASIKQITDLEFVNGAFMMTGPGTSLEGLGEIPSRFNAYELILLRDVEEALAGLNHGEITITVRSGKVIQIERIARTKPLHRK